MFDEQETQEAKIGLEHEQAHAFLPEVGVLWANAAE